MGESGKRQKWRCYPNLPLPVGDAFWLGENALTLFAVVGSVCHGADNASSGIPMVYVSYTNQEVLLEAPWTGFAMIGNETKQRKLPNHGTLSENVVQTCPDAKSRP